MEYFKVNTIENLGDDWLMADFGTDQDGKHYIVTTNHIHASDTADILRGAKEDAELVCRLLNEHFSRLAEKEKLNRWNGCSIRGSE